MRLFLHVGNQKNIRIKDIIGIFDMDRSTVSTTTRKYLSGAEKEGRVSAANEEIPKSFVLYYADREDGGRDWKICMSQISSASLAGRLIGDRGLIDEETEDNGNGETEVDGDEIFPETDLPESDHESR